MALKKKTEAVIPCTLHIKGQNQDIKLNVNYHNRKQSEVVAKLQEESGTVAKTLLFMVESWESEYDLTEAGVQEAEDDFPGIVMAIIEGFHDARSVARVKN